MAFVGSAVLHLVGIPLLLATSHSGAQNAPSDTRSPDVEDPAVTLGADSSRAITVAWLGFDQPTPHDAPPRETEQSAMTRAPGVTDADRPPSPTSSQAPLPARAIVEALADAAARSGVSLERLGRQLAAALAVTFSSDNASETEALAEQTTQPQAAPEAQPSPATPRRGTPGIPTTREAVATALRRAIDVNPGQVLVAHGMEISTVSPRWSITTRLTRLPENPHVLVRFDWNERTGTWRVGDASFANWEGVIQSTGYADVDDPLLTAIFNWTARGRTPDQIAGGATSFVIAFRILLR